MNEQLKTAEAEAEAEEADKPNKHYHVHIVSNGVILVRELEPNEVPKPLPFLGHTGYDAKKKTTLVSPAELGYRIEVIIKGLAVLDPKESLKLGKTKKENDEFGNRLIREANL